MAILLVIDFEVMIKGTDGGIRIAALEVKFLDRRKTDNCESICQECFH